MEEMIDMDKKIISIFLILLIVVSITVLYGTIREPTSDEYSEGYSIGEGPTEEDISNELDDTFISEDDEIDIGDMI